LTPPRAATLGFAVITVLAGSVTSAVASALAATLSKAQPIPNMATAWGFNEDGELGNHTTQNSDVPVEVSAVRDVMAIASGRRYSLALLGNGTVVGWGENVYGQLGDGTTENRDVPVAVSGLSQVAAVAAGEDHSLALLKDGSVMAWGRNRSGQLGDGGTNGSDVPVPIRGLGKVAAISAGGSFSLALLTDGTVMAWGENLNGQLGDGTTANSYVPVPVGGLIGVTAISAGFRHSLALLSSATVMAWGENEYGQLGDGTETQRDRPVAVSNLAGVRAISAGESQSVGVVRGGAVVAWGDNEEGQLGDGTHAGPEHCGAPPLASCSKTPVAVRGLRHVIAISAGGHNLALLGDGAVMAWGPNNVGQLGVGSPIGPEACSPSAIACSTIPVRSSTHSAATAISAGAEFSLALGSAPPGPLPELGRCVRVSTGGAYRGATPNCLKLSSTHEGHFEWLPGPGPKARFDERLNSPEVETVGGSKLSCLFAVLQGEYTGAKTEAISHLMFAGCRDVTRNVSCQSIPLEEGVIESSVQLEGHLGFITGRGRASVGWEIQPTEPRRSLASFVCGSGVSAMAEVLEGSVIARARPINAIASAFEVQYRERKGKQMPEVFAGGERHVITLTTTPAMREGTSEQAALRSGGVVTVEEPLEIKAKA
jgi:alpha-tubulin suppressor-like RCC1 family protein